MTKVSIEAAGRKAMRELALRDCECVRDLEVSQVDKEGLLHIRSYTPKALTESEKKAFERQGLQLQKTVFSNQPENQDIDTYFGDEGAAFYFSLKR